MEQYKISFSDPSIT